MGIEDRKTLKWIAAGGVVYIAVVFGGTFGMRAAFPEDRDGSVTGKLRAAAPR